MTDKGYSGSVFHFTLTEVAKHNAAIRKLWVDWKSKRSNGI